MPLDCLTRHSGTHTALEPRGGWMGGGAGSLGFPPHFLVLHPTLWGSVNPPRGPHSRPLSHGESGAQGSGLAGL